jgi:hypothetical protein
MARTSKTAWPGILGRHSNCAGGHARRARSPVATGVTVDQAVADFLGALDDGSARDRYGRRFDEDAVRELRWALRAHVDDPMRALGLRQVRRDDVEALIDRLAREGLSRRHLRGVAKSMRALYDYAHERGLADRNPAERVALPDEDEHEQPRLRRERPRPRTEPRLRSADHALALVMQAATLGFALLALIFIAESL